MVLRLMGEIARMQNEYRIASVLCRASSGNGGNAANACGFGKTGVCVAGRECSVRIRFGSPA